MITVQYVLTVQTYSTVHDYSAVYICMKYPDYSTVHILTVQCILTAQSVLKVQ